jgi:hypothetical protein
VGWEDNSKKQISGGNDRKKSKVKGKGKGKSKGKCKCKCKCKCKSAYRSLHCAFAKSANAPVEMTRFGVRKDRGKSRSPEGMTERKARSRAKARAADSGLL